MKTGVNENGVRWVLNNNEYQCYYYLGSKIELYATYSNVTQQFIEGLSFYDIFNKHMKVKKK